MSVYLDSSILVGFVFGEPRWTQASDAIAEHEERCLGNLCWGEFVDQVCRRVRRHELKEDHARMIVVRVRDFLSAWRWVEASADDVRTATALMIDHPARSIKLVDAIHIAAAARIGATLVTFDDRQRAAAALLGVPSPTFTRSQELS